jgi:hypothetical protein
MTISTARELIGGLQTSPNSDAPLEDSSMEPEKLEI